MTDLPIKATFKSGAGYDAPWLTIDAADPEDLDVKLDAFLGSDSLAKVIEVANLFKAANNAAPLATNGPDAPAAPAAAPAAPAQQQGWGNRPQGGGQGNYGAQTHPEGKTCELAGCGQVLEFKKTSGGKGTWRCPAWRWNNGNPNGHSQEWQ